VLKRKKFYIQNLADELIELRCGDHSTGNIYEWLLKAYGDANRAKVDFMRLLPGELPTSVLQMAAEWISEEQGSEHQPESCNGQAVRIRQAVDEPIELSHG
jgi:hypothetical protein